MIDKSAKLKRKSMLGIPYIEGIVGNKKAKKIKGVTFE